MEIMLPFFYEILFATFLLTFNAGYINSLTINNSFEISSSHVTGIYTKLAQALFFKEYTLMLYYVLTISSFFVGCILSGLLIDHEKFEFGYKYGIALFFITVFLSIGLIMEEYSIENIPFIMACSLSCGMQNALMSKYSGNIVRTTHLTGTTTDFGIVIGHILKGDKTEVWKVIMNGICIFGFLLGSYIGTIVYFHYKHIALCINISFTLLLAIGYQIKLFFKVH